jgi:hypothetical protein
MFDYNKTLNDLDIHNKNKALYVICCVLILLICLCSILCVYDTYYAWYDLPDNAWMTIQIVSYKEDGTFDYLTYRTLRNDDEYYFQYKMVDDFIYTKHILRESGKVEIMNCYKTYGLQYLYF